MKVDVEQVEACVRRLMIEVPADRVDREFDTLYRDLQRRVKIPGFRPGKVPRRILENRYRHSVEQEVLQKLVPDALSEALTQAGILPVGQPQVDQFDLHQDQPFRFVSTAQVLPEFTLNPYNGWSFERRLMRVDDTHVDRALEQLRERHAELHTVSGRPVAKGDFVILNYEGRYDGRPLPRSSGSNVTLEVGAGRFLPEIEEGLIGLEQGEDKVIAVGLPEDHNDADMAGKTIDFHVSIIEIKEKMLPDLNDDFAKSYEEEETLEALRQRVRTDVEETARQEADRVLWRHILDRLVSDNPIEVPEILVHEQMLQLYAQQVRLEQGRALTEEELHIDPEALRESYGEQALNAARGQVILHHLEATLGLTVSPDEVDAEVASMASRRAQNAEALKRSLEQRGYLDTLRGQLVERKVFQSLTEAMVITDTLVSEDELAPDDIEAATALPEEG